MKNDLGLWIDVMFLLFCYTAGAALFALTVSFIVYYFTDFHFFRWLLKKFR